MTGTSTERNQFISAHGRACIFWPTCLLLPYGPFGSPWSFSTNWYMMSLTILTWIFSLITVCFISCLAGIHSFVIWVVQLYKLWDLVGWWISKEQHTIFVVFFFPPQKVMDKETSSNDRNYTPFLKECRLCLFVFQSMWKQKRKHNVSSS